ncbi:probable polyol transporter 6 [Aristolochia californica]|uniref:probable polyol transporter 6 n=1 Tax=Aristolochia californica TaxID=171875 RepID=UPI0035E1F162
MEIKEKEKRNKYAFACVIMSSLIALLMGYDTGVMSGAMIFIKEDIKITDVQLEVLAGILNFCAFAGSLVAGRTSDWIGRRYTICVASVIFFSGSILMGLAPTYPMLLFGRCVAGIGVGFALMISPVYSAELSSPSFRGQLTSLNEINISVGILLGYVANYLFAKLPLKYGWRTMLGIGAFPSFALAVAVIAMPESPRWLVMQGRVGQAKKVLLRVSNSEQEAESRLRDIKVAAGIDENCQDEFVKPSKQAKGEGVWKELLIRPSRSVKRILIATVGIHFLQHAVGIEAVVLYSPRIFQGAGVHGKNNLLIATVGVGITKTVFILVATFFADKIGRKALLLISTTGALISLLALGTGLTVVQHSHDTVMWAFVVSIASVFTYIAFFSMGLGPVTWIYTSEIWPLRLRAQGASIGVAVNRIMNATLSTSFISLYQAITIGGSFFLFAGIAALAWLFFFFFLPETKGRHLEEMEMLFARKKGEKVQQQYRNEAELCAS